MSQPVIFWDERDFAVNILISNDDGVFAPGIQALAQSLKALGRVVVVAPESERSGFSSALTLDRPLRPIQIAPDVWAVNGTPADCVYLAMNGLFDVEFDLVVSGINSGANLDDFIAAGLPALPERQIFNVNIPDIAELKGTKVTFQGRRSQSKPISSHVDPRGRQVYWIGLSGEAVAMPKHQGTEIESDFFAIANGYVSVTPIQMDATNYDVLHELQGQILNKI